MGRAADSVQSGPAPSLHAASPRDIVMGHQPPSRPVALRPNRNTTTTSRPTALSKADQRKLCAVSFVYPRYSSRALSRLSKIVPAIFGSTEPIKTRTATLDCEKWRRALWQKSSRHSENHRVRTACPQRPFTLFRRSLPRACAKRARRKETLPPSGRLRQRRPFCCQEWSAAGHSWCRPWFQRGGQCRPCRRKLCAHNQLRSRGDWTPIELFATGAGELTGSLRAFVLAA